VPLFFFGLVASFLILMAGLGLVGVLWQAVTRRTEEMGIRRALGATARRVQWQILGELLVLTTAGVLIGSAIFLQMPILQIIGWIPWEAYLLSLGASLLIIYLFVVVCGLYPSWLATRIHPAEALQYE
jgi:putative ABC transport system permease protein